MPENKSNLIPKVRFVGDGATTEFFFNFMIFTSDDVDIYLDTQKSDKGYEVIINNDNGGKVVFATPPLANVIITVIRNLELKRTSDFQEGGAFRAKVINHELDYQVASILQLNEKISRAITLPPYASTQKDVSLPLPDAGKALIWNKEENALTNSIVKVDNLVNEVIDFKNQAAVSAEIAVKNATNSENCMAQTVESAELAKIYAVGTQEELPEGSAKYWAAFSEICANTVDVKNRISNCLTSCEQNPFLEISNSSTITLLGNITALMPQGLNEDNFSKNNKTIHGTSGSAVKINYPAYTGQAHILLNEDGSLSCYRKYIEQVSMPSKINGETVWFESVANKMLISANNGGTWSTLNAVKIGEIYITNNVITSLSCKLPYEILTQNEYHRLISIINKVAMGCSVNPTCVEFTIPGWSSTFKIMGGSASSGVEFTLPKAFDFHKTYSSAIHVGTAGVVMTEDLNYTLNLTKNRFLTTYPNAVTVRWLSIGI